MLRLSRADHCRHLGLYGCMYVDQDREYAWRAGVVLACGVDSRTVEACDCRSCGRREGADAPVRTLPGLGWVAASPLRAREAALDAIGDDGKGLLLNER